MAGSRWRGKYLGYCDAPCAGVRPAVNTASKCGATAEREQSSRRAMEKAAAVAVAAEERERALAPCAFIYSHRSTGGSASCSGGSLSGSELGPLAVPPLAAALPLL